MRSRDVKVQKSPFEVLDGQLPLISMMSPHSLLMSRLKVKGHFRSKEVSRYYQCNIAYFKMDRYRRGSIHDVSRNCL